MIQRTPMKKREFRHNISRDLLELSRKATMKQRLQRLEEMQNFIRSAVPEKNLKWWQERKQKIAE